MPVTDTVVVVVVVMMAAGLGRRALVGAHDDDAAAHLDHVDIDPVEIAQPFTRQYLGRRPDRPTPGYEIEHAVDVGKDRD